MTIEKVLLEVCTLGSFMIHYGAAQWHCYVAAFLTQTVTLDDQTTVKFEIWYVHQ